MLTFDKPTEHSLLTGPTVDAYVIFQDNDTQKWLKIFTRPMFRHCCIAVRQIIDEDNDMFVLIDPTLGVMKTEMVYSREQILSFDATIVEVSMKVDKEPMATYWWSCVEVIKRTLGMREFMTWTPHQLYRSLLDRHGGKLIKREK